MSCSEWIETKLGDVSTDIFSGGTPSTKIEDYWNGEHKWLSSGETRNKFIFGTEKTITELGVQNSSTRLAKVNDVVIASAGQGHTRGQVSFCVVDTYINQSLIAVRTDYKRLNPYFLLYNLSNRYEELRQLSDGNSIRGSLTTKYIKSLPILLPTMVEQKAIADTLSCLDDKIELNNRINNSLEEMAQAIFKSWFVDFEPFQDGKFEDSELGPIPKGWKVESLDNIADFLNGLPMQKYRPTSEESLPVIKIKELSQGFTDSTSDKASASIPEKYIIDDGDVVFSWSGTLMVKLWTGGPGGLNQHLFKVTSKKYDKWFYHLWTIQHLASFIAFAQDRATTMGHIKRGHLTEAKVLVPSDLVMSELSGTMNPIYQQIIEVNVQNRILEDIRDTLLPKLMSGEIRVSFEEVG